jgi:hypothetical protein
MHSTPNSIAVLGSLSTMHVSKQKLSSISMPRCKNQPIASVVTTAEDGGPGFAGGGGTILQPLYLYVVKGCMCMGSTKTV